MIFTDFVGISPSENGSADQVTLLFTSEKILNSLKHLKLVKKNSHRPPLKYKFQNILIPSHLSESIVVPAWCLSFLSVVSIRV